MDLFRWIDFPPLGDDRGSLVAMEVDINIPFDVKRVYALSKTNYGVTRGLHAHRKLKQVMICIAGSCNVLLDNGLQKGSTRLFSNSKGILVEGLIWREMSVFSEDCVLLVLASDHYDEADYIRDYNEFLSEVESFRI